MFKKWMGVALLAGWLVQGTVVLAQDLPACGPPRIPEPLPCPPPAVPGKLPPYSKPTLNAGKDLVPGPISPLVAPRGPGEDASLPEDIKNAFPCKECETPSHIYFHLGSQAFQRQGLGHRTTAVIDSTNASMGLDTGMAPAQQDEVSVQDQNDLHPRMAFGVKGTLGYLSEELGCAVELSGFYIPQYGKSTTLTNPGQLNSFFINPPVGFEGDNGLWLQADRISTGFSTTQTSVELNVKSFSKIFYGCLEPFVGVRYFHLRERLNVFTDDDGVSFPMSNGLPDPTRQANYMTRVNTNLIAPQFGVEYQYCLFPGLAFGFYGKAAPGISFNDVQVNLTRGDGLVGLNQSRSRRTFSQVYESGLFFDVYWLERMRVRAGYTTLWLVNIPVASDQVNFDLSSSVGTQKNTGSIFFHGPSLELQFLF